MHHTNSRIKLIKQAFVLMSFSIMVFYAQNTPAQNAVTGQVSPKVIQSGCEPDYPPFCIVTPDSIADGFSVELLRAVMKTMGYDITFEIGFWNEILQRLQQKRFQVLPLVGRTPERESDFDFSFPYLRMHGTIVVRENDTSISTLGDLKGKHVAVMKNDNAEEFIRRNDPGARITTTISFENALQDLSEQKCDAVIIQTLLAQQLIKKLQLLNIHTVETPLTEFEQVFCFAVPKGNHELLSIINEGLAIVISDGTFSHLYTKWFLPVERITRSKHKIIVGGDNDYPPYEFIDQDGNPAGYNVELTRAIAEELGIEVEIQLGTWAQTRDGLKSKKIDVIPGMFYSVKRDAEFDFSPPHTSIGHVIVTNDRSVNLDLIDFKKIGDKKIVVMKGDIMHDLAVEKGLQSQLVFTKTQEDALKLLADNQYTFALVARTPALYWIKKHHWNNVYVASRTLLAADYCYAVMHGEGALISEFNEGLRILEEKGTYRKIYSKWLGIYESNNLNLVDRLKYSLFVIIPILVIVAVLILWSAMLKKTVALRTAELQKEIEERKKAEISLKEEKERLAVTLGSIGDGVITTDTNGKIVIINKVAQQLTGYTQTEAEGRLLQDIFVIVNEQSRKPCENPVEKVLATGNVIELANHTLLIAKDGTERLIADSGAPIKDSENTTIGVVLVFRDVTEKHKLLETIQQTNRLKSLGVLAGGIAHDFNNILGAIIGYADMSLDVVPTGSRLEVYVNQILKASDRAKQLIKQILSFSRQGADIKSPLLVKPVIEEAIQLLRASLPSSITIKTNFADESMPVNGNATQIHEIIMNLGTNAAQAMKEKGTLEINLEEKYIEKDIHGRIGSSHPGLYSVITVSDDGCGMSKTVLTHIFEPFFTTKPVGEGSGMGLAMVFGIIMNHDGNIVVESEPDQGTQITILLPKINTTIEITEPQNTLFTGGTERILFIDDEEALCTLIKDMLGKMGYTVTAFTDSLEALNTFKLSPADYDLVITDQTMPVISGFELSKEFLSIRKDIPVILCTGYSKTIEPQDALNAGISDFCMKPLRKNELAKKIRDVLDKKGDK